MRLSAKPLDAGGSSLHDIVSLIPTYLDVFFGKATVEYGLPSEGMLPRSEMDFTIESLLRYMRDAHRSAKSSSRTLPSRRARMSEKLSGEMRGGHIGG